MEGIKGIKKMNRDAEDKGDEDINLFIPSIPLIPVELLLCSQ